MVMQQVLDFLVGGSKPGGANMPPPPLQKAHRPGFEPPTIIAAFYCVTIRPAVVCGRYASPLLGAWSAKTFDPPHPPHPPLSAQISATTKRGCRPWAGPPWGPGNRGAGLLLPPPPPTEMGPKAGPAQPPPPSMPSHPRTLTAGRHMVIKVPPLTDRERTPNDGYVGIWDPHGNPAGGPPLPNK